MPTENAPSLMRRIVGGAMAHSGLTVVLALIAAAFGVLSFQGLSRDVFPDLSAPLFNVIVQHPAMAAEELELEVAIPLEAALNGIPGVRRVRSSSQPGVCTVTVEFEPDEDYFRSRQLVGERVASVSGELPQGGEPPLISSLAGRLNEIMEFTLESKEGTADLMALRDLAEFEVKNRLLAIPGVAGVERLGGYLREVQVLLNPEQLVARGVTLQEVEHALEGANENASGGFVVQGSLEWSVRTVGRVEMLEDLRQTVVAIRGDTPVLLGDVADVREGPAVRRGIAHRLSGEVVSGRVVKQFGADTVQVAQDVRVALEGIRRTLPEGVSLRIVYDQSELVESSLGGVSRAIMLGGLLVVLVLFLLLGDWRAAAIVTLSLPLSIATAGLLLERTGVGLNTMTLGGLAIAVGLLVDAGIIVVENIVHRLRSETGAARKKLALDAAVEVGRPITFATLIVMAVFVPLFSMSGIEGRMYRPLAAAVVACLATALVLALTLIPVAAAMVLRPRKEGVDEDTRFIRAVKTVYAPLLDKAMHHAGAVRLLTLLITIPVLALAFRIGSDFMPSMDEGALLIQTVIPAEASLQEVDKLNHRVEDVLRTFPEVDEVVRRTGRSEQTEDPMPHTISDVLVVLKPERKRSLAELEAAMREALVDVPGVTALFTTPLGMRIDEGLGGTPADLSVKIFGPDAEVLSRLAAKAETLITPIEGVTDLRVERLTGLPQIRVRLNRTALAREGLTPADVNRTVRIGLVGEQVSVVWQGQRRYDLVLRLADPWRSDLAALHSLRVDTHDGRRVPLTQLASIEETLGLGTIRREAGSRRIAVEAGVSGRDLGGVASEVETRLRELELPTGYFVEVGGRIEQQERANRSLMIAIGFALLAVGLLLYLALGTISETLVILATLPDAFVGGILALLLTGETWNVSSMVGLIGLFGIAVQNGLVLVTQTRELTAQGLPFDQALRTASLGRVRPKLMTAGTAILGLLPLLVLPLHGVEVERPLAIVMVGGLLTSTLFTLLALPTFYTFSNAWQEHRRARKDGVK